MTAAGTSSPSARSCSGSIQAKDESPRRASSRAGRAAASTTSRAAWRASSGCVPRSSPRWRTTRSADSSRTSSARGSRPVARPLGPVRWRRTDDPKWTQLHRARPRRSRGVGDLRPRPHGRLADARPDEIDWDHIFGSEGARWFHTGGIYAALSETTPDVVAEAIAAARRHGTIVSYDLNYRPSLWRSIGGQERARAVNREIVRSVDVLLGNEEDFTAALGFEVAGLDPDLSALDPANFGRMIEDVVAAYPNLRVVATTLRAARTATRNDWGAVCWSDGTLYTATPRPDLEILDRVGGGDSVRRRARVRLPRRAGAGARRCVRGGPRRPRHDNPGRHLDGDPCRSRAGHARRGSAGRQVGPRRRRGKLHRQRPCYPPAVPWPGAGDRTMPIEPRDLAWNASTVADFRQHAGQITTGSLAGANVLLLTAQGAPGGPPTPLPAAIFRGGGPRRRRRVGRRRSPHPGPVLSTGKPPPPHQTGAPPVRGQGPWSGGQEWWHLLDLGPGAGGPPFAARFQGRPPSWAWGTHLRGTLYESGGR